MFLGRQYPATQMGQYQFRSLDISGYGWPASGTDYAGNPVTATQMETTLHSIVTALQGGQYLEVQDAKGRHMYGTFTADPEISDDTGSTGYPGWQTVSCTFVETAAPAGGST